jgi:DNA polymerase III sliding clamp (beta) subunit (PCNA family)
MTMTEPRPEAASTSAEPVSLAITWQHLADLASVSACAATDDARPLLTCVHLFTRDGVLVAEATDSYSLARATLGTVTKGESIPSALDVLIPAKWLRATLKSLKITREPYQVLTLTVEGPEHRQTVALSNIDATIATLAISGNYPKVDHLIPDDGAYSELGAFCPQFIARMADILPKVGPHDTTRAWQCVAMDKSRPSLWRASARGVSAQFLQMPVRIN